MHSVAATLNDALTIGTKTAQFGEVAPFTINKKPL